MQTSDEENSGQISTEAVEPQLMTASALSPQLGRSNLMGFDHLPMEIIWDIYGHLSPVQFNAARHTCRNWRRASLNELTLRRMMARAGFQSGIELDPAFKDCTDSVSLCLLMSQRFSRECALLPFWKGFGLGGSDSNIYKDPHELGGGNTGLVQTTTTDMSDLGLVAATPLCGRSCGLAFTISACERFALVTEGCTIYIYDLDGQNLVPVTSVICPKRVLAVSMDTSERRFAVAALLDGRMGLVCDLDLDEVHKEPPSPQVYSDTSQTLVARHRMVEEHELYAGAEQIPLPGDQVTTTALPSDSSPPLPTFAGQRRRRDEMDDNDGGRVNSIHIRSAHQSVSLINASQRHQSNQTWRDRVTPFGGLSALRSASDYPSAFPVERSAIFNCRGGITNRTCVRLEAIPISPAALSIYNALCSPDDPPRSVAICPSRRCVAFGCSAGVELHWVDARGGRNLMKWFPLTAPSDCLFFLPTRPGLDGPNKLRLISSKTGPGQREKGSARQANEAAFGNPRKRRRWSAWPFLQLNSESASASDAQEYDHYSALPISDGTHLVFTDPASGALCLGSDAPLGNSTRLLRKVKFVPPPQTFASSAGAVESMPNQYSPSTNLAWGVKVVAVYGTEKIVLYSVPPDVFADITRLGATAVLSAHVNDEQWCFGEWSKWWPTAPDASPDVASQVDPNQSGNPCFWPVVVPGVLIDSVPNIVEIGIQDDGPSPTIWAFTREGVAHTWRLGDPRRPITHRVVERNGLVVDVVERNGDWIVRDMWGNEEESERDVNMSEAPASRQCDSDGDMRMRGFDGSSSASSDFSAADDDLVLEVLASAGTGSLDGDVDMVDVAPRDDVHGVTWILDPAAGRRRAEQRLDRGATAPAQVDGPNEEDFERWTSNSPRVPSCYGRHGVWRTRQGRTRMQPRQRERYDDLRRCSPAAGQDGGIGGGVGLGASRWARCVS